MVVHAVSITTLHCDSLVMVVRLARDNNYAPGLGAICFLTATTKHASASGLHTLLSSKRAKDLLGTVQLASPGVT